MSEASLHKVSTALRWGSTYPSSYDEKEKRACDRVCMVTATNREGMGCSLT